MRSLLFAAMMVLALSANAQSKVIVNSQNTIVNSKASTAAPAFKLVTVNPAVANLVLKTYNATPTLKRYSVAYKKDRYGLYPQYSFNLAMDAQDKIVALIKTVKND